MKMANKINVSKQFRIEGLVAAFVLSAWLAGGGVVGCAQQMEWGWNPCSRCPGSFALRGCWRRSC